MCYEWVFVRIVFLFQKQLKKKKKRLGWREGNGWACGIFSFLLTKDWPLKQTNKKQKVVQEKQQKLMGKFALEGLSGQTLCGGGGGVECLHDILYHKILI